MVTISRPEMERVLRLPGIASRDQNRVEVSGQQLYYSEGKVQADYSNKKGNKFPCVAGKTSHIIKLFHINHFTLSY